MLAQLSKQVDDWCRSAAAVDWNGSFSSLEACQALSQQLTESKFLQELLMTLPINSKLLEQCEQLQGIKKLVLIDDTANDIKLRIHLFEDYAFDVAHNHKWSFFSTVLKGGYTQFLHGEVGNNATTEDIQKMPVSTATRYEEGDSYFLRHNMVHSLRALPKTVTLVIRGPILRQQSLWHDFKSKKQWYHQGDETDSLKRKLRVHETEATVSKISSLLK